MKVWRRGDIPETEAGWYFLTLGFRILRSVGASLLEAERNPARSICISSVNSSMKYKYKLISTIITNNIYVYLLCIYDTPVCTSSIFLANMVTYAHTGVSGSLVYICLTVVVFSLTDTDRCSHRWTDTVSPGDILFL